MLLRQVGQYNDLSQEFRDEIEGKVRAFGKVVRYKFDISNNNPDPQKHDGKVIWPNMYTLDPATFLINDPFEKRAGKSKSKRIGLIDTEDYQNGNAIVTKFRKVKVDGRNKGILKLDIGENEEHFWYAVYLELHPKQMSGQFADKTKRQIFTRIDELAAATTARAERSAKQIATTYAQGMSEKQLIDFADAMSGGGNNAEWDSSADELILRNQIEELAENDPIFFNDLVKGANIEYQALIKRCLNKGVILFNPAEYSFVYGGNKQPIVTLSPNGEKNEVEKMAEWLQSGGKEVYKKIKSLDEAK